MEARERSRGNDRPVTVRCLWLVLAILPAVDLALDDIHQRVQSFVRRLACEQHLSDLSCMVMELLVVKE